jgi:alpha-amylase
VAKGTRPLQINFDQQCWQPAGAIKLNQMLSMEPCRGTPPQWRVFREGRYTLEVDTRSGTPTLMLSLEKKRRRQPRRSCASVRNGMVSR